ncbi:organic solute transporter subunit alpha-like isoform X2 [Mizuhopecten yessoensis]|uniref:organic solute transporter subunit alpha-like isoform X2 n=1 Tax=Mizuhopecten yessoensis TaxID=6573 RepID=UPI000B45849D|nr:organic solute transporter subunit alpha-like isoform X2 [Mizuhopecten yessoensis]
MNCSKEFPTTGVLYKLLSSDTAVLALTAITCTITCITIGLFAEEVWFLFHHCHESSKRTKIILLLALYPIVSFASSLCILVPTSTLIGEFVSSIYLSFCIFIFVNLAIECFGGLNNMLNEYYDQTISFRTGPCCCFCIWLRYIPLTRRTMTLIKGLVLQVAILRPLNMFILAVMWSDGKFELNQQTDFTNPAAYFNLVNTVSTLLAIYGLMVTFRATREKLKTYRMTPRFISLQGALLFINLQSFITGFLGRAGIPECSNTIGSTVRASRVNHFLLIMEMFLLALLARYAYRAVEETIVVSEMNGTNGNQRGPSNDVTKNGNSVADTEVEIDNEVSSFPQEAGHPLV